MVAKGKTQTYLDENPEAKAKKNEYQKEYNKKPSQVKKRVELNKANRKSHKNGTTKVGDGKDQSHTKNGLVLKPQSVNRGSTKDSSGDKRARGKKK
jgi:hypothetical protein